MSKVQSTIYLLFFAGLIIASAGCKEQAASSASSTMIALTARETGIDFENTLKDSPTLNIIEYLYYYNGGGVAIGDIDNDGLEDLYFTANQGPDKLYLNKGQLKFEDISAKAGIAQDATWSTGVAMEDLNNDGFLDIVVCKVGVGKMPDAHNLVYLNQGNGTFKEVSKEWGLDFKGYSTQSAFLDYDKDGDLDMYLLNHNVHSIRNYGSTAIRTQTDSLAGDRFYENRLNEEAKSFVDVTRETGIYSSPLGYGLAITCADINGDGWTDIYVGNDFHENDYIYINNKNKTFSEQIDQWTDHTTQFSMGVDIADLNNDLLPDVFSTDMLPYAPEIYLQSGGEDTDQIKRIKADFGFENQYARNHLQLNTGMGTFIELGQMTKTFATDWSWSVLMQDFDNNGRRDIFVTNGIVKRPNDLDFITYLNSEAISKYAEDDPERTRLLIERMPSQKLRNILFLQNDDLAFSDVNSSEVGAPTFSNGAACADLDGDGLLEIVVNNINEPANILKFQAKENPGNYINVSLKDPSGKTTNGATVIAYANGQAIMQEKQSVKGYQSSSSHSIHIGLGASKKIDSLVVFWPDLTEQRLTGVQANASVVIAKGDNLATRNRFSSWVPGQFTALPLLHEENTFHDDEFEKLIPERLSHEGPAVIYEDLDGDGIKDLLVGGAHGYAARLLKGKPGGVFENLEVEDFTRDARYEDVSAATVDFDGDGDRDIYIASGGSGVKELDKGLEDRLYLNNGNMEFRRIPISLPHTNASVVAVADFDKDGFEDIFVGARSIPGSYGLSPYSFVLKNMGGMGIKIAARYRFGMITDAHWVDLDADKDLDLALCGDWMPVTLLKNTGQDTLIFNPEENPFPKLTGFWNTMAFADVNKDGKLDVLAGNMGTNVLYQASEEQPIRMYLGDFDKNEAVDPLILFRYFSRYVPLGGREKYLSQLPGLKSQFAGHVDFANIQSFETMLPKAARERLVEEKAVNELRSMLFLSESGGYKAIPLPERVQMMDVRDMLYDEDSASFYYIGGNDEWVAVHGNAMSTRAGILANFDASKQRFGKDAWMDCPTGINARRLIPLGGKKGLVVTNGGYIYIVDLI